MKQKYYIIIITIMFLGQIAYTLFAIIRDQINFDFMMNFLLLFLVILLTLLFSVYQFSYKQVDNGIKYLPKIGYYLVLLIFNFSVIIVYLYSYILFENTFVTANGVFVFAIVFDILLIYNYFKTYVILYDDYIRVSYIIGIKAKNIYFKDITKVKFYGWLGILVIKSKKTNAVIDITLNGIHKVLNAISENVEEDKYNDAFYKLANFYRSLVFVKNKKHLTFFNNLEVNKDNLNN